MTIQIDVKEVNAGNNLVICNLSTSERDVRIAMSYSDYEELIRDKFFIRDGEKRDSANIVNTTAIYYTAK